MLGGTGMALVFSPVANAILGAVKPHEAGQASGANNAIRELGGVLGVAVLAAVFSATGGYESGQAFVDGLRPASGSARRCWRRGPWRHCSCPGGGVSARQRRSRPRTLCRCRPENGALTMREPRPFEPSPHQPLLTFSYNSRSK